MTPVLLFIIGLLFLIVGAEALVRGASKLARAFGISPLVIGLTVVAFGTSSPELAVSIGSVLSGQAGIAVGNVVGSNIFNVLFILGVSALIVPLSAAQQLVRKEVPLMIALSVLVLIFSLNGNFSRLEGLSLVGGLAVYLWYLFTGSRKEQRSVKNENAEEINQENSWLLNTGLVVAGLLLLVLGSRWLVESAVIFATFLGVSELVIGLTIVAAGTSLPEVVTSIIAAIRGERDIAVGNVVGSNIFNLMAVLGISGLLAKGGIEISAAVIRFDLPVMIAVALACLPVFFTGGVISRKEGLLLLGYYLAYTTYLILAAGHHDAISEFSAAMLYFVIPLTAVTLAVIVCREFQIRKKRRKSQD